MISNADPDASLGLTAGFVLFTAAFTLLTAALYRPLFRRGTPGPGGPRSGGRR